MLSGRGLCDELISRPEESYRLCCVVCDLETSRIGAPYIYIYIYIYDISSLRVNSLYSLVMLSGNGTRNFFAWQLYKIAVPVKKGMWVFMCRKR